jgi:hypothetical protein
MASSVSHSLARIVTSLGSAALIAALSACAQTGDVVGAYPDERCQAVFELPDGTWRIERPVMFGRTVRVESGATVYKGEVIDGIDLGAVLQRMCRDPSSNLPETVVRF